jgi:hypothetical protein
VSNARPRLNPPAPATTHPAGKSQQRRPGFRHPASRCLNFVQTKGEHVFSPRLRQTRRVTHKDIHRNCELVALLWIAVLVMLFGREMSH